MDTILFLKTNHLDSETRGCQKKRERGSRDSEGPDTVINVSKKAAGLQPFITQSGHFGVGATPKAGHKVTRTPSNSDTGVSTDFMGGEGHPRTFPHWAITWPFHTGNPDSDTISGRPQSKHREPHG